MKYNQLKILLADEHPVFRIGLRKILGDDEGFSIMDEAESGQELLEKVGSTSFDLLLMDVSYPDSDGIALLRRMMAQNKNLAVLVISALKDEDVIMGVLKAGARGYLLKSAGPEEFLRAIRAVAAGQSFLSPEVSSKLLPLLMRQETESPHPPGPYLEALTPREKQVLRLIYDEYTNPEIAEQLSISRRTVDTHRKNLLHKTGVRNTVGLIKYALREGLVWP